MLQILFNLSEFLRPSYFKSDKTESNTYGNHQCDIKLDFKKEGTLIVNPSNLYVSSAEFLTCSWK